MRFAVVIARAGGEVRRLAASGSPVPLPRRVALLQRWCQQSLAALEVEVQVEGTAPSSGLLVSNHLSYLDILALSAAAPCAFVSKAEVHAWPYIGRFAECGGTIFVERALRSSSRQVNQQITDYLRQGVAVVLFPEGTTTDGSEVLRFHSSMIQPAIDAGAPVIPCSLAYEVSGGTEKDAAWWGAMTLFPHAWKLLGKPTIRAKVAFGAPLPPLGNRKALSDAARQSVIGLRTRLMDSQALAIRGKSV